MRLLIRKCRLLRNYTQKDLYSNLCSRRHYLRIEKGEIIPSVFILYHLSKKLCVAMEDLIVIEKEDMLPQDIIIKEE